MVIERLAVKHGVVVVGKVPSVDVVDVTVAIIVDAGLSVEFGLVDPNVVHKVYMIDIDSCVDDSH